MVKMLTLFGKDISKMKYNELKRERRVQSLLLTRVRAFANYCHELRESKADLDRSYTEREDKDIFFSMYVQHLEALIAEIDYWLDRRYEPESNYTSHRSKKQIREENAKRRLLYLKDNRARCHFKETKHKDILVQWDRERFDMIAADRGYQTEEVILSVIAEELRLDRTRAKMLIDSGRFTWGQVLCLGTVFQMTPKEFCDTFLAGYFTEQYGEYRADYENVNRTQLLKRAVKAGPEPVFEEVVVGSDGRPIDEEEWFDD